MGTFYFLTAASVRGEDTLGSRS